MAENEPSAASKNKRKQVVDTMTVSSEDNNNKLSANKESGYSKPLSEKKDKHSAAPATTADKVWLKSKEGGRKITGYFGLPKGSPPKENK